MAEQDQVGERGYLHGCCHLRLSISKAWSQMHDFGADARSITMITRLDMYVRLMELVWTWRL
jgi:hypothetical protein